MSFKKRIKSKNGYFFADIFALSNQLIITVTSASGKPDLQYPQSDEIRLELNVKNTFAAITGNSGTAGQLVIYNNILKVQATDQNKGLGHSFFGQIITMIED